MCVFAADLDGDGDADALATSYTDDAVYWYENQGVVGPWPRTKITDAAKGAHTVFAEDLDGDGDMDVLSASPLDDKVAWYENLGGGAFGPQEVISTAGDSPQAVFAADLDGDGDNDVLSASHVDDTIAWYQNLGGGNFGPQQVITTSAGGAWWVHAEDLDGDGDADVLSVGYWANKVAWYENLSGCTELIGTSYCGPAVPNSSGASGVIAATGSDEVARDCVTLSAAGLATNQFAMFLNSQTQGLVVPPGSQGNLCLGGAIGRYRDDLQNTGASGAATLALDLSDTPTPTGSVAIQAGETWNYQLWFRDAAPGPTSNLTDGVSILFR